jgi:ABC-2 type transport system ATP-binding protein
MNIIEVNALTKHYREVHAVNGISFSITQGQCFGLLGPNGAGKTTTIEIIEGINAPTSGEILFLGEKLGHPRDNRFSQQAGIQFQQTALMDYLTVRETLALFATFYPRTMALPQLIELCDLQEFINQRSTKLSGGQRQRLLLALALINDPLIVFLDEPTTGLDPQSRRNFWELVKRIRAQGKTIVLTTHYMDEAQQLCDELIIMDHGHIVDQGSPQQLLAKHFQHISVAVCRDDFPTGTTDIDGDIITTDDDVLIQTRSVERTIAQLIANHVPLTSLRVHNPTLEDVFIKLTGHGLRA